MNKAVKSAPRCLPELAPVVSLPQPSFHLSANSHDCIAALKVLLKKAESGKLPGFVYAAFIGDDIQDLTIRMEAVGMADEHRLFSVGVLTTLSHSLMEKELKQ